MDLDLSLGPGSVLLEKYRVDEVLGTGGMGRVVRASHLYLQQPVAIKILLPQMAENAETVSRFLREAQATVKLRSEHIARVMDVGTMPNGTPFMVMEYLDGNDLNQILRHHGPQRAAVVVDLMLQACEGMAEAHAIGIVHRDIKPSNFFITRRPDGSMLLKILDFGISKTPVGVTELTGSQTVIGTPTYMAPEQMRSGRHADARSDVWSMGIVMYQLVSGRPPFIGEAYQELVLKVATELPPPLSIPLPAGLGEVIMRCIDKDPRSRPQNVGELARMLAPFASDPLTAMQSANRSVRILQNRTAQAQQGLPVAANGGLATPIAPISPISPSQLARGWPPAPGSSLTHGSGQVTLRTRGNRGLMIAGIAAVVIVAGVGGYAASTWLKGSSEPQRRDEPYVQAPPPKEEAPAPPVVVKKAPEAPPEPPPEPKALELTGEARHVADTTPLPPAPPEDPAPPVVAERPPAQTPPPTQKVVTKPADGKKPPVPARPKKPKDEELFNSRH
ncbi:MAG: serine/threonine protein kinase [Deltaproteobacteria bacterium]|nr:serine/threonine protein kinase [Deltaproteobacteria bacterium]MCW5804539.1 serine/threonine protein kinase [Deltaproteobacteria bacterium]